MWKRKPDMINIDADFDFWLPVPKAWPWQHHADVDAWAQAVATAFGDAYDWDEQTRTWCADSVRTLSIEAPEEEQRLAVIDPDAGWIFFTSVIWTPTVEELTVEQLAAADDENAIRGIDVQEFPTQGFGTGVRTVRYVDDQSGSGQVVGIIQHGLRAHGFDVMVVSASHDVILLQELAPEIDDLVRSINVD